MSEAAVRTEVGLDNIWCEINNLGLQPYIEHLDTHGYTVIPPEIAKPNGLTERMLETCLDIAERRTGERPDLVRGKSRNADSLIGDGMKALLLEDSVFEEALMNPALLAVSTYLHQTSNTSPDFPRDFALASRELPVLSWRQSTKIQRSRVAIRQMV